MTPWLGSGWSTSVPGPETPSRLVLDTSAYARMRRGDERVITLVAGAEVVHLPVVVLGELEGGFRAGRRTADNRLLLEAFLDEPYVSLLPVTRDVAVRYGRLFAELRSSGTPVPANDIWIAATTMDSGARLITFDTDFARFPALDALVLA